MNKIIIQFIIIAALCNSLTAQSEVSNDVEPHNLDIYLLIGQSNMAGRAIIESQDLDTLSGVFLYKGIKGNVWEKAANPLNKYSTIRKDLSMQRLNPGYTFGREMSKTSVKQIGLVVNAKGGSSIDLWMPDLEFYENIINRLKSAKKYGSLKGILWHQGESDVSNYHSYMPKLLKLIQTLRSDLNEPDLPFIAGQLSNDKTNRKGFNQMILELPNRTKHTAVVKSNHTRTLDSTHFDSASQRLLGKRYAKEMLLLQSK